MKTLRDSAGIMLGIGDSVQLCGRVSAVYPGEALNIQVKIRINGSEVPVLIHSSHLTRTGTLLEESARALAKDVKEMKSDEVAVKKDKL